MRRLKRCRDHIGVQRMSEPTRLEAEGTKQARSSASESIGWTAARKDDAGYFGKLATAAASLS